MRKTKKSGQIAFMALLALAVTRLAFAHAVVIDSSPKDYQVLRQPPVEVMLRFNAKIEKSLTFISLFNSRGKPVPLPVFKKTGAGEEAANILLAPMPHLEAGSYTLRYKVFSTDGHSTLGALHFTISEQP